MKTTLAVALAVLTLTLPAFGQEALPPELAAIATSVGEQRGDADIKRIHKKGDPKPPPANKPGNKPGSKPPSPQPPAPPAPPSESRAGGGAGSDNGIGVLAMAAFNAHQGMPPVMVPTPAVPSVDLGRVAIEAEVRPCANNAERRFIPVKGLSKLAYLCPEEIGKINILPLQGAVTPAAQAPPPAQADESQTSTPIWEPKFALSGGLGYGTINGSDFAMPITIGGEFAPTVWPVWFRATIGGALVHANNKIVGRFAVELPALLVRWDHVYIGFAQRWVGNLAKQPEVDMVYAAVGGILGYCGKPWGESKWSACAEAYGGYRWSGLMGVGPHIEGMFSLRRELF